MKALVIGGGGREHALAWKMAQSPRATEIFVAPGNGGTARTARLTNLNISDPQALATFARTQGIGLTVVGPEAPLAQGVVDHFRQQGLPIFGPSQQAAQLESSKDFAKSFMVRHGIPTAQHQTFTDAKQAKAYVASQPLPIVIKADGLAAGKGVIVAETQEQAYDTIDSMLDEGAFGAAGSRVVIEEFLEGEEASFIVMCDGETIVPMASSQDHKRLLDGDQGPNTGGMGAYSPTPIVSPTLHERIMQEVIKPTIEGLRADGIRYTGFLYAGLMIGDGPDHSRPLKVLEYNCRMGDPEAQPILIRLQSDLIDLFEHAITGTLAHATPTWDPRPALGVVVAAKGYPDNVRQHDPITQLPDDTPDCVIFHAGTQWQDGKLTTSGGRVLCVTALGETLSQARDRAYDAVRHIHLPGAQYRRDIAWRAL